MEPIVLHSLEQLLYVAIGGLSIFLGYRLFFHMPGDHDSKGNRSLPGGVSIYISRILPGIFFALFGAGIVAVSGYSSAIYIGSHTKITQTGSHTDGEYFGGITKVGSVPTVAKIGSVPTVAPSTKAWDSLDLVLEMEFLNTLPSHLRTDLNEAERRMIRARIERSKLVVMSYVWEPQWGRFEDLRRWIDDGSPDPIPPNLTEAVAYYRQGREGKP